MPWLLHSGAGMSHCAPKLAGFTRNASSHRYVVVCVYMRARPFAAFSPSGGMHAQAERDVRATSSGCDRRVGGEDVDICAHVTVVHTAERTVLVQRRDIAGSSFLTGYDFGRCVARCSVRRVATADMGLLSLSRARSTRDVVCVSRSMVDVFRDCADVKVRLSQHGHGCRVVC